MWVFCESGGRKSAPTKTRDVIWSWLIKICVYVANKKGIFIIVLKSVLKLNNLNLLLHD